MAVITIAVCDEIRKDAQKLYRQLSTLLPDAEILIYRSRQSLLDGLTLAKLQKIFGEIIFRSSW